MRPSLPRFRAVGYVLAKFALAVLEEAIDACGCADFQLTPETRDAVAEMRSEQAGRCPGWAFDQLRHALESDEPIGRWQNVHAAMNTIRRANR